MATAVLAAAGLIGIAPTATSAAPPGATAATAATLAASVERLRHLRTAAVTAASDTAAELSALSAAQSSAGQRLADTLRVLQERRAANSVHIRELYVSGGNLSMFGELLTGGRPEDFFDRARLAETLVATDTGNSRAAVAATREAADLSASIAVLADRQITLATRAGLRAAQLTDDLSRLAAQLTTAQAKARAEARAEARGKARAEAQAARVAAELRAARDAASSVFTWAGRAGSAGSRHLPAGTVPAAYRAAIARAGLRCPGTLTPALLAAQLVTESGWNPLAVSSSGAQGLAQFLPGTWAEHGIDGDGDGRAQAFNPFDAIASAAGYDCAVSRMVAGVPGDPVATMLAAYNAGPGAVVAAGGVPAAPGVVGYIEKIRRLAARYLG